MFRSIHPFILLTSFSLSFAALFWAKQRALTAEGPPSVVGQCFYNEKVGRIFKISFPAKAKGVAVILENVATEARFKPKNWQEVKGLELGAHLVPSLPPHGSKNVMNLGAKKARPMVYPVPCPF